MRAPSPALDEALDILSRSGSFAGRSETTRAAIAGIAQLRNYGAGQAIYLVNDAPNGIFGLVRGALDLTLPRADGMDLIVHRADPGFWFGDLALLASEKRLVSVFAAAPTLVVHLPQRDLGQLVQQDGRYYADFYALTYENMATALRLLGNLATTPSEVRVAMRLLLQTELQSDGEPDIWLSHAKMAELLALSAPTLQRILRRFQREGLIEVGYGRIRVVDRKGLVSLCDGSGST